MFEAPAVQKNVSCLDVSGKLFAQISIKSKQSDAIGKVYCIENILKKVSVKQYSQ